MKSAARTGHLLLRIREVRSWSAVKLTLSLSAGWFVAAQGFADRDCMEIKRKMDSIRS